MVVVVVGGGAAVDVGWQFWPTMPRRPVSTPALSRENVAYFFLAECSLLCLLLSSSSRRVKDKRRGTAVR